VRPLTSQNVAGIVQNNMHGDGQWPAARQTKYWRVASRKQRSTPRASVRLLLVWSNPINLTQQQTNSSASVFLAESSEAGQMKRDDESDRCNMTELRYDAPLATFDGEEWSEFLDDDDDDDDVDGRDRDGSSVQYADSLPAAAADHRPRHRDEPDGGGCSPKTGGDGFGDDAFSGSLEDLVSCFDENVRHCFRNYSADTEFIAPVQIRTHEEVLHESQ